MYKYGGQKEIVLTDYRCGYTIGDAGDSSSPTGLTRKIV
jgi:hypothetical protein